MNNKELAVKIAKILDNKKALDTKIIDIAEKSGFADFFVLATGMSERQVGTLSDEVLEEMAKIDIFPKTVEGKTESGWILLDFGDIIVNLFLDEQRNKYNLEKVWADCEMVLFE